MKRIGLILAISIIVGACGEDATTPAPTPYQLGFRASEADLPPRPELQPGESNWTADELTTTLSTTSSTLTTTDLNTVTPADLANALVAGPGVTVSNVMFAGLSHAGGAFSGGTGIIGIESGVCLSSGNIASVPGPNTSDAITTNNGEPGDADLAGLIPGFVSLDRSVLEFDFQCGAGALAGKLQFNFVFTSDEYNEFTNSSFNDVFGFFLNGTNIALLPDNVTPVSINNVNGGNPFECINSFDDDSDGSTDGADSDCTVANDNIVGERNSNTAFYINNDCSDPDFGTPCPINTEMDGLTTVLQASGSVLGGANHIKLAISDAGDRVLDSNVFIEGGSFTCVVDVDIDTKPESDPNSINCNNPDEVIAVAILTTGDFDAITVDHTTATFHGATEIHVNKKEFEAKRHEEDVDYDGDLDLVLHFRLGDTDLTCGATEGTVTAQTLGGLFIQGTDAVKMIDVGSGV